jgi:hypothetical protein
MYEGNRESVKQNNGGAALFKNDIEDCPLEKQKDAYSEIADIFPALQKYKDEHSETNLKRLMIEIIGFCRNVYASTKNDSERKIYRLFIEKLNK